MKKIIVTDTIKCLLILLFCYTAVSKWLAYDDFIYQLRQSPFIKSGYTLLSFLLPAIEVSICLLLLFSRTAKAGFAASAILLALFTGYIIIMLVFVPQVPCSCGGFLSWLSWKQHIILNSVMCVLSLIGYITQSGLKSTIPQHIEGLK